MYTAAITSSIVVIFDRYTAVPILYAPSLFRPVYPADTDTG